MHPLTQIIFPQLHYRWSPVELDRFAKFYFERSRSNVNPLLDPIEQDKWIGKIHTLLQCDYSYGGYLEDRSTLWMGHYHNPKCMIHLGLDFNVPAYTDIYMPYAGTIVFEKDDKDQSGGWGGRKDFYNEDGQFYFILGHLKLGVNIGTGYKVLKNIPTGMSVGGTSENGGWFPHLHLQLVSKKKYESYSDPMEIDGYAEAKPGLCEEFPVPTVHCFPKVGKD